MDKLVSDLLPTLDVDLGDAESVRRHLISNLVQLVGIDPQRATRRDWYFALAYLVRGTLGRRTIDTVKAVNRGDAKRVYYLSMEFLPGRSLIKNLIDLGIVDTVRQVLGDAGIELEELAECEPDAALGNGGLGRLAACIMDALATHRYAGVGYGLRYEFGMFNQGIEKGEQVEHPEGWLRYGNPWEYQRPAVIYRVHFHGRVNRETDTAGREICQWVDTEQVIAMAFDNPVAGFGSRGVANLRLWAARATRDFDLEDFNEGNYVEAVRHKTLSENLSKVLYPNDNTHMGQELRLKQEYFFVSASLQDILRRHLAHHKTFDRLPDRAAIQLNDTHPALAVAELMRLLVDVHGYVWGRAWDITTRTFSYTNHTLLPEALETWSIDMLGSVLPRHLEIIYRINDAFLKQVRKALPDDIGALGRMSLIDDATRRVRMAHLAIVGSHRVNGVAALHTQLLRASTFADFDKFYPGKFINMTNGVTPRRWIRQANPQLAALFSRHIGDGWIADLDRLGELKPLVDDAGFRAECMAIKLANKQRLATYLNRLMKLEINPNSLFDIQVKRIHEYKRQLLNVLHVITRYNRIRDGQTDIQPRTVILAGKAAPGYAMAKLIIRLINDVAAVVNNDPRVGSRLKLAFIPNYNVTAAEIIMPACDLSEQISTAGTEASGTGNMKLGMNGALTIGTLDGANIEILEAVGEDNMFIFGLTAEEADKLRRDGYDSQVFIEAEPELKRAIEMIGQGAFSPDEPHRYRAIVETLLGGDRYLLCADYAAYIACQDKVDAAFADNEAWSRGAAVNITSLGHFSIDRTVHAYAQDIWDIKPLDF